MAVVIRQNIENVTGQFTILKRNADENYWQDLIKRAEKRYNKSADVRVMNRYTRSMVIGPYKFLYIQKSVWG